MRILVLMEALSVTGPAKNLLNFCDWARSAEGATAGVSMTLATTSRYPDPTGETNGFVQAARQAGLPMHVMSERYRFDRRVIRQLQELVERVQPDLIQTHNVKPHFLVKAAGVARSRPWIAFHHGYTWTTLTMEVYNQLDRWSLRSAKRVVTVCQAFVPELQARGVDSRAIRVLHNSVAAPAPVAATELRELSTQFGLTPGIRVLVTIGRLSREKGHADLLEALAILRRRNPDWKAILVGDGPERPHLEELARRLGMEEQVIFAGFQTRTAPFFALADLFVLPSHSEGSPNVLLEAMMAGVPIVATRVGGTPEVVADERTALLTPARNPQALAAALEQLLSNEGLRAGLRESAFERARTVFSPEQYRRTLLEIYAGVSV